VTQATYGEKTLGRRDFLNSKVFLDPRGKCWRILAVENGGGPGIVTQEAEIRSTAVRGQPRQKVREIPPQSISQVWWYLPVIPAM
jgi:hypothetical protein